MKIFKLILTCFFCFIVSFVFVQKENGHKIKMTSRVNQKDIIAVQHTYIPPHVKGDKDFDGDCDLSSTATLKISADQTKLYIELYFKAKELSIPE